ncbi:alpha-L-arabinofuranosidase [Cryobacterium zongtaii]|uniref:Alpha-L-arabinofuranosidase n=1 Tax=Cryobacterium zongtaii TaxID=1259217 RepID=A0A2S3ZK59_9MICO|nr:RICIN domain-containing protein [Cryobacterium zongtaii]POH68427.1 alpha-L-arabinofuranosidase [Cryobacterium zongtaii]
MGRRSFVFIAAIVTAVIAAVVAPISFADQATAVGEPTFQNAIFNGADPTIEYHNGNYYLAATTWTNQVTMSKSPTLAGLKTAAVATVYSDTTPGRNSTMWAPELQRLQGPNGWRWYLMYTMGGTRSADTQHLHVLESAGDDPMGPYLYKGRPIPTDSWHIDGAYMQLGDELFTLWSQIAPDGRQSNYIARMSNPWTATGPGSLLSQPTETWETVGGAVNEGPVPLQRAGKTYIVYSASGCWTPDYQLGMLTYLGGDPAQSASWTKSTGAVFSKANGAYGPGHNDFFTSPDGTQTWNAYHGNDLASQGCDTTRTTRAQPLSWDSANSPVFSQPASTSTPLAVPSGELGPITAQVSAASWQLINRNSGQCASVATSPVPDGAGLIQTPCTDAAANWKWDSTADGWYRLVNSVSGKSLDSANCGTANGTGARQWSWIANSCQQWRPTTTTSGSVTIANRANGMVLDAANCASVAGSAIQQWTGLGNTCQEWSLRPAGVVGIVSAASGKSFDLPYCSNSNGAALQQWQWVDSPCQRWTFTPSTDGYLEIHAATAPSLCLTVANNSPTDGAPITQATCGALNSKWQAEPTTDGFTKFVSAATGKVLDLAGCSSNDGAAIAQWSNLNNQCQRFRITP